MFQVCLNFEQIISSSYVAVNTRNDGAREFQDTSWFSKKMFWLLVMVSSVPLENLQIIIVIILQLLYYR